MTAHRNTAQALAARSQFAKRLARSVRAALVLITISLGIGVIGYHAVGLGWLDALLNAAMILTGMGPVDPMQTTAGKLFASFYALFSGIAFLSSVTVFLAPVLHRFMHRFHLEDR